MKGRKQYWFIFLRTLAVFLAFWLAMMLVLTKQNQGRMESIIEQKYMSNVHDLVPINVKSALENGAPLEEKIGYLTSLLDTGSGYNGRTLGTTRIYDSAGTELARTPISFGYIVLKGAFPVDYYLLFDSVLSDEEQITLANRLQTEWDNFSAFVGEASGENDYPKAWPNKGLYGEVTGVVEGNCICPKKLVFHYEDRSVVFVDSDHEMFAHAELTTLRFDYANVGSAISSPYRSAEDLLVMYRQANALTDRALDGGRPSASSGISVGGGNGRADVGEDFHTGVLMARAYVYSPWRIATYGLQNIYVLTFLGALAAAIFFARMQIKSLKKERQFTRSVAHELKTPVAVLRAYAEVLEEDAVPEKRQEYLNAIVEESDRMAVLVNELLDLSRMEGSTGVLVKESVDLTTLVQDGFERLRAPMRERALALVLNVEPVTLKGDPKRLGQVVNNLAVNALNHATEGGVYVTLTRKGERAVLTMRNDCPYVSNEVLRKIWKPFYKLDESRSGEGSGLGLAVVKNIVELHGGTCRAEWRDGSICFTVELPL